MTYEWQRRASEIDASVNFIAKKEYGGALEARFVQRSSEYFIAYLSRIFTDHVNVFNYLTGLTRNTDECIACAYMYVRTYTLFHRNRYITNYI